MNIKSISYSLLKILAIWIVVNSFIPSLISICLVLIEPYKNSANYDTTTYILWSLQIVAYLIISLFLWFGANKISDSINKNYSENREVESERLEFQKNKVIEIGLIIIGFYVLIIQIPNLLNHLITLIDYSSYGGNAVSTRSIGGLIQSLTSIGIALYFITGRDKIVNIISKLRTVGVQKTV